MIRLQGVDVVRGLNIHLIILKMAVQPPVEAVLIISYRTMCYSNKGATAWKKSEKDQKLPMLLHFAGIVVTNNRIALLRI